MQAKLSCGTVVKVGDVVCFKSDTEQCGTVKEIKRNNFGRAELVLTSKNGFRGDYIGGSLVTSQLASDCWSE